MTNCTARSFEECFFVAHGAHHNEFVNCYGDNAAKGTAFNNVFMVRDGACENTFRNCHGVGNKQVACVYTYEDYVDERLDSVQANNSFVNCIFENGIVGVFLGNAQNTALRNCTIVNIANLFRFGRNIAGVDQNNGIRIENCIVYGVADPCDTRSLAAPYSYTSSPERGHSDRGDLEASFSVSVQ